MNASASLSKNTSDLFLYRKKNNNTVAKIVNKDRNNFPVICKPKAIPGFSINVILKKSPMTFIDD